MTVEPFLPDTAPALPAARNRGDAPLFERLLDGLGASLQKANAAEDAFAAGRGDLQDAVYQRARADVALSVATAAAQRAAQALQSIMTMQV